MLLHVFKKSEESNTEGELKLAKIVQSAAVHRYKFLGNRQEIKGVRSCCMNIQQEKVVEALV